MDKNVKPIEDTLKLFKEVMQDATRVSIWFEILRTPGITAKNLMKIISIKKTAMYYHLDLLKNNRIITFDLDKKEKHFRIIQNFFSLLFDKKTIKGKDKEIDLFFLHIINSLVQREITRINNIKSETYNREKNPIPVYGLWCCDQTKLTQIKEEYTRFYTKIQELDKDEGPETIAKTPMVYYWGILNFIR